LYFNILQFLYTKNDSSSQTSKGSLNRLLNRREMPRVPKLNLYSNTASRFESQLAVAPLVSFEEKFQVLFRFLLEVEVRWVLEERCEEES